MKKHIFFGLLLLLYNVANAQFTPDQKDLLIDDVYPPLEQQEDNTFKKSASTYDYYNDFKNWIPYYNSEPLKNPPIKFIEVSFHVFLDKNGQNNDYTNSLTGKNKLLDVLNTVNHIYSSGWKPSDPVSGVTELPNQDTKIRFTLGDQNERIFFYNDTSMNQSWSSNTLYSYIQTNYPSRLGKLNVFFVAGYYQGKVKQDNIIITNGGSGYSTAPNISFTPSGASATAIIQNGVLTGINLTNEGSYNGFTPPQITITGGNGSGATATVTTLSQGATGYANMPSANNLSLNHHVVMLHCHKSDDWISGMTLAHEFGHNLGLRHTYCGGGASVVCCSGTCTQGCTQSCSNDEYLSDIFGSCPGTCPHYTGWYDPTASDPKHTNNVMGGSNSQLYFSPMQAGQMHRSLALFSVRKYVKEETFSSLPLTITNNETWTHDLKLYRNINITSNSVLTINNTFKLPYNSKITINNGAALIISGTLKLADNNQIIVKDGGSIKFSSTSNVEINGSGIIEVQRGAYFCIETGSSITLSNYNSIINLRNGYINGTNTILFPSYNCVSSPDSYTITGNGQINTFDQDVYIQNEVITTNRYYTGRNIFIGKNVTNSKPQGNVVIQNNSEIILDASQEVKFDTGVTINTGSSCEIKDK